LTAKRLDGTLLLTLIRTDALKHDTAAVEEIAAQRAQQRTLAARWDINIALALFALLIVVIILVSQDVRIEIVAPIAIVGLAAVWLIGWLRGRKWYQRYYEEELAELREVSKDTIGETIETQVQKALRERLQLEEQQHQTDTKD